MLPAFLVILHPPSLFFFGNRRRKEKKRKTHQHKENMDFKNGHSSEEIKTLRAWFESHKTEIPASLQLDEATFIPDLPTTFDNFLSVAELHGNNPTYRGQIHLLFKMKKRMDELDASASS